MKGSCPKRMVYGPCGGVTSDGLCEVDAHPCPFLELDTLPQWPPPDPTDESPRRPGGGALEHRFWVDFRPDPTLEWEITDAADVLGGLGAGVLIGEHVDDETPHPPSVVAAAVIEAGLDAIATLTCRDRDEGAMRVEIGGLRDAGVAAIHCVTGDHPAARLGLDVDPPFPLDGTRLAALASPSGAVSVAESPASPPRSGRPGRLLSKQRAGADIAILNHAGSPARMIAFSEACADEGVTLDFVAPVPVITDHRSAAALERFPGLELPDGLVDGILGSSQPQETGIDAAVAIGSELLASGRFVALNLSGAAGDVGIAQRSWIMASVMERLR